MKLQRSSMTEKSTPILATLLGYYFILDDMTQLLEEVIKLSFISLVGPYSAGLKNVWSLTDLMQVDNDKTIVHAYKFCHLESNDNRTGLLIPKPKKTIIITFVNIHIQKKTYYIILWNMWYSFRKLYNI
ncbi:hypothetical protein ACJX0J_036010, partial [Zea mays]